MLKDVLIATRLARSYGLSLGATEAARDSLVAEARKERGDYDYASLIHSFFPDGPPGTQRADEDEEVGEQTSLAGLEEATERGEAAPPGEHSDPAADAKAAADDEPAGDTDVTEQPEESSVVSDEDEPTPAELDENGGEGEQDKQPAEVERVTEPLRVESEAASEPEPAAKAETADEKNGERRGFFSRMFSRDADY